jgi:hypothetical protein
MENASGTGCEGLHEAPDLAKKSKITEKTLMYLLFGLSTVRLPHAIRGFLSASHPL